MLFYCIVSRKIKGKLAPKLFLGYILPFSNTFFIFKGIVMQTYHAYYLLRMATDFALQATVTAQSLRKNISGSTWSRWETLTKCAFLTLPFPRLACSATLLRTSSSSSRQYRSRLRLLRPVLRHRQGRRVKLHVGRWCPTCPSGPPKSYWKTTTRPLRFSGVLETSVTVRDAPVLCMEIAVLLAKDAIAPVPPAEMKQGFYSPYFIVPKKSSGLWPIWIWASWIGPFTSFRSGCWSRSASSVASNPRIGLQWLTWRTRTFMSRFFLNTGHSYGCIWGSDMAVAKQ